MKTPTISGVLSAGLLMLASSFTQAVGVSGRGSWETTLQGRDLDGNLSTAEAYYDTVLGITWLGDASAAAAMNWTTANAWAGGLNPYGSDITGWRLPDTDPVNGLGYNYGGNFYDGSNDRGYNISAPGTTYAGSTGSEMAHLYYNTLGNLSYYDTSGSSPQTGWGLTNTGPFANVRSSYYWSATAYGLNASYAWFFNFGNVGNGGQDGRPRTNGGYAWAVHAGDVGVSTVPVPAAVWLFGSGLLGLGAAVRKRWWE